ncbi:hypothetical protein ACIBBE_23945 [Streptomyces sp. NPDC051644]|uniref:hypothetical protein n=1 Tax=Streptomyces sp. NPDC051644 TaxID=3365666 RepID=UPI00378A9306
MTTDSLFSARAEVSATVNLGRHLPNFERRRLVNYLDLDDDTQITQAASFVDWLTGAVRARGLDLDVIDRRMSNPAALYALTTAGPQGDAAPGHFLAVEPERNSPDLNRFMRRAAQHFYRVHWDVDHERTPDCATPTCT